MKNMTNKLPQVLYLHPCRQCTHVQIKEEKRISAIAEKVTLYLPFKVSITVIPFIFGVLDITGQMTEKKTMESKKCLQNWLYNALIKNLSSLGDGILRYFHRTRKVATTKQLPNTSTATAGSSSNTASRYIHDMMSIL